VSLIAAILVVISSKGQKLHVNAGRVFFWGVFTIFITAIPMSIMNSDIFLFLIAIFSFYLAFAGMRFAINRTGIASSFLDWFASVLMVLSGLSMWLLAIYYVINDISQYITLTIFGSLAIVLGYTDFRSYKNKHAVGNKELQGT